MGAPFACDRSTSRRRAGPTSRVDPPPHVRSGRERLCCPFLKVAPIRGPLWLRLTGPDRVKDLSGPSCVCRPRDRFPPCADAGPLDRLFPSGRVARDRGGYFVRLSFRERRSAWLAVLGALALSAYGHCCDPPALELRAGVCRVRRRVHRAITGLGLGGRPTLTRSLGLPRRRHVCVWDGPHHVRSPRASLDSARCPVPVVSPRGSPAQCGSGHRQ